MNRAFQLASCTATALLLLPACAIDSPDGPLAMRADATCAPTGWSEWSAPLNVGSVVNSPFNELSPELSKDGLALYFGSNRPGGFGGNDLWVSTRASTDDPWGAPVHLAALSSTGGDNGVHISRDGHWLYLTSTRPGGEGGNDLWVSYRQDVHDPLAWGEPVNLGSPPNSAGADLAGSIAGPEFYFFRADQGTGLNGDIWLSMMTGNAFSEPVLVTELNTSAHEGKPSVRYDGREIVFFSNRGDGNLDLWYSTRRGAGQRWSEPVELEAVNSAANDSRPNLSADGTVLLFDSTRPGGAGGTDLYVSTREHGCTP
jgi:Tol biopolymer transport system component